MKFIHLSDLHIGKRVNGFSMIEDQKHILNEIYDICISEQPQAIVIAGDIYDKNVPSKEAITLFDDFLYRLAHNRFTVMLISGNHDSAEHISFGNRLMQASMVYVSPAFDGNVTKVTLSDTSGDVNFYLLPYIALAHVRAIYNNTNIKNYTDAIRTILSHINIDKTSRNILVAHQLVTGASRCESESISIGGIDNVDADVFKDIDYVALGHIHGAQSISRDTIHYCGTPLKYSFSEVNHKKSVTIVEMERKGHISIRKTPLVPLHDMRELHGSFNMLTDPLYYNSIPSEDYVHITLTDENMIPNALGKLRCIYKNIMKLDYDNKRTRITNSLPVMKSVEQKTPLELFTEFYKQQNNTNMSNEQLEFVQSLIDSIQEDE